MSRSKIFVKAQNVVVTYFNTRLEHSISVKIGIQSFKDVRLPFLDITDPIFSIFNLQIFIFILTTSSALFYASGLYTFLHAYLWRTWNLEFFSKSKNVLCVVRFLSTRIEIPHVFSFTMEKNNMPFVKISSRSTYPPARSPFTILLLKCINSIIKSASILLKLPFLMVT